MSLVDPVSTVWICASHPSRRSIREVNTPPVGNEVDFCRSFLSRNPADSYSETAGRHPPPYQLVIKQPPQNRRWRTIAERPGFMRLRRQSSDGDGLRDSGGGFTGRTRGWHVFAIFETRTREAGERGAMWSYASHDRRPFAQPP